jgi:hypothetical protein
MYQLAQLDHDLHRERLALAEAQRPGERVLALARATPPRRVRRTAAARPAPGPDRQRPVTTRRYQPATATPTTTEEVTMNRTRPFHPVRRLAGILAALAAALLAAATAAPAAFALPVPPVGGGGTVLPPSVQTVVVGGMPGWQIALIAMAAAVLAAAVSVLLDRARAARRHQVAPSA